MQHHCWPKGCNWINLLTLGLWARFTFLQPTNQPTGRVNQRSRYEPRMWSQIASPWRDNARSDVMKKFASNRPAKRHLSAFTSGRAENLPESHYYCTHHKSYCVCWNHHCRHPTLYLTSFIRQQPKQTPISHQERQHFASSIQPTLNKLTTDLVRTLIDDRANKLNPSLMTISLIYIPVIH